LSFGKGIGFSHAVTENIADLAPMGRNYNEPEFPSLTSAPNVIRENTAHFRGVT